MHRTYAFCTDINKVLGKYTKYCRTDITQVIMILTVFKCLHIQFEVFNMLTITAAAAAATDDVMVVVMIKRVKKCTGLQHTLHILVHTHDCQPIYDTMSHTQSLKIST
jgi:hypothetical protein